MVTEKPILFSGPMVRAILEGRKTQTRRLMKPQPPSPESVRKQGGVGPSFITDDCKPGVWRPCGSVWAVREVCGVEAWRCPYGAPGDRLWVRETWAEADGRYSLVPLAYRADGEEQVGVWHWRPSIHMPRWASRITLEVTGVRVECLQSITEADTRAEGVDWAAAHRYGEKWDDDREDPREVGYPPAGGSFGRDNFRRLWDQINGKRAGWDTNPWVWVVEFRRVAP